MKNSDKIGPMNFCLFFYSLDTTDERVSFFPLIFQAVDLVYFLLIMVVFFLAYGVAQQAILYPQLELPSWSMASRVFFRPYFQAHGELFMDAPDISKNFITHVRNN